MPDYSSPNGRETYRIIKEFAEPLFPGCRIFGANPDQDANEATDLVILWRGQELGFARRIRSLAALEKYAHDYTIRAKCKWGPTEIDKIRSGYGYASLYGFGDETAIKRWTIYSLDKWRQHDLDGSLGEGKRVYNNDGTVGLAWDFRKTPDIILAKSW